MSRHGHPPRLKLEQQNLTNLVPAPKTSRLFSEKLPSKSSPSTGNTSTSSYAHKHTNSLHVNWTETDIIRLAKELNDEVIAEVHLSLLAYWICENGEHYETAKRYIRELALDQGYNIERIQNVHLRKLLKDIHEVRPKCVYKGVLETNLTLFPLSKPHKYNDLLEPRHAANMKRYKKLTISRQSPQDQLRSSSTPLSTSCPPLNKAIQPGVENTVRGDMRSFTVAVLTSPTKDYPPNTPDRPAPLTLRSSSSKMGLATPRSGNAACSVSSPFSDMFSMDLSSPSLSRNSILLEDTASHPLLSPTRVTSRNGSDKKDTDDVFGIVDEIHNHPGNKFNGMAATERNLGHGRDSNSISRETVNELPTSAYESEATDAESDGSYETILESCSHYSHEDTEGDFGEDAGHHINESLRDTESLDASVDEISILETASNASSDEHQTQYFFSPRRRTSASEATVVSSRPSSQNQNYFNTTQPVRVLQSTHFSRPLPFRKYGDGEEVRHEVRYRRSSEQVARSQGKKSIFSPLFQSGSEGLPLSDPPHSLPCSLHLNNKPDGIPNSYGSTEALHPSTKHSQEAKAHDKSTQTEGEATASLSSSSSRPLSFTSTLTAFPIPTMHSPLGELPMSLSRLTSRTKSSSSSSTAVNEPHNAPDLELSIKAHITALLERTRHQGEQLPRVEWNKLNIFERLWREKNKALLVGIYGRKDVLLCEADVTNVECIARQVGSNGSASSEWVRSLFRGVS